MKNKFSVLLLFVVLGGAFIAFQRRTVTTVSSPQPVTPGHGAPSPTASTSSQATNPALSMPAPAISRQPAVAELEKIFATLPAGPFRASLMKLPATDRRRALAKLAGLNVPKEDYPSLRASVGGELYYVCNDLIPPAALAASTTLETTAAATTANASVPLASPPVRHSKPGSTKILYLDFNGHTISGTMWNSDNGVTTYQAQPYDTDGDPTTFSDTEQTVIIEVWSRVAEDYAPFDVDVTTEAPSSFTKNTGRALITKNTDANGVAMPSSSAGGVAYLDVFGDANYATATSPALIYYNNLAGGTNASFIGEAVSHELGHNMGLSHDGKTDGTAYYTGHGSGETSWAPIMGSPYNKNVTQWSKGEYYLANNTEDDLATISGKLTYRADEAGATTGTATALSVSSGSFSTSGLINNSTDVDVYSASLGAGSLTLSVTGFRAANGTDGGNTDIKLELLNSSGTILSTADPTDSTKASLTYTVATAGTYYVRLTPVGTGTPTASTPTGYTNYGCIGQYTLTGLGAGTVAPSISTQPASQTVTSGSSVTFSVIASGTPTPTYQWYFNSSAISGATSTSYMIASTTTANAGSYTVTVTNSAGNVTSSAATLTVNVTPFISTQPAATTITAGNTATLSVVASGTPSPTYQWYQGSSGITTAPVSGATAASFTTPALTATTSFWVRVTNSAGSVNSSTATITVNAVTVTPSISVQPASTSITSGNTATLSILASGTPTPSYQWYQGASGITTAPVSGATAASFTTPALTATTSYWVRVTNSAGSVDSTTTTVTVTIATVAPSISTQPAPQTVTAGNSVTFSAIASGTPTPTYQWYFNNSAISGATSTSYTIASTTTANAGSYTVTATNSAGNVTSFAATLTVNVAPTISTQPASTSITSGNTVTLSVVASGTPSPTYQWYQGSSTTTTAPVSGAIAASFTTPTLTATSSYWVRISNAAGSVDSATATLTVNPANVAPTISTQPISQSISPSNTATLSIVASGTPAPTYQWYQGTSGNTTAPASGATAASFTTPALSATTSYWVRVTNSVGSIDSATATITVTTLTVAPSISSQPASQTVTAGNIVTFSLVASGTPTPTYQWYFNNSAISGATSASYTIASTTTANAGSYTVTATNSAGNVTSFAATLTVNVAPSISTQPASTSTTSGNTATLSVVASGTPSPTYQWYQGASGSTTAPVSGATATSFTTPALTATTSYWVRVTNSVRSIDSATATITVSASVPVITSNTMAGGAVAEPFTYTITATNQPTTFSASGLPAGLSVNNATGAITGTPTASGTFSVTLGATNASSTGNVTLSLIITPSAAIVTLAGKSGATGANDATATTATFNAPNDIAINAAGVIYVADTGNHTIRKISLDSTVSTVAGLAGTSGTTNANGTSARFSAPSGIAIDSSGNLYVADTDNSTIRKIDPSANVTTLAGSPGVTGTTDATGTNARFNHPSDLSLDSSGNLYVADTANHTIRKITSAGVVTTLAGQAVIPGSADGTGTAAQFSSPADVVVVNSSTLYVADSGNHTIRKISLSGNTATVTTLAGLAGSPGSADGVGAAARFNGVNGMTLGSDGYLYAADTSNHIVRRINPADGLVVTLVGAAGNAGSIDGIGASARLDYPLGLAADSSGDIYVADSSSPTIRQLGFYGSPGFITQPSAQTATAGTNVTFTVSANGQPVPTYQWYKDSTALSGATSSSLTLSNVQSANAGSYTVTATNVVGTATSNAAALSVTASGGTSSSSSGSSSSSSSSSGSSNASGGGGGGAPTSSYLLSLGLLCILRKALRNSKRKSV